MKKHLDIFSARQESKIHKNIFRKAANLSRGIGLKLGKFFKKILIASGVILTMFLLSAAIYWQSGGKFNFNEKNPSNNNNEVENSGDWRDILDLNSTEDKNIIGESLGTKFLYFVKNENGKAAVYKKGLSAGSEMQNIFEFSDQRSAGLNVQSLNIQPNAAMSAKNNLIAYVDNGGLNLYDLNAKNSQQLIKKTSEAIVNLAVAPKWLPDMPGVYILRSPRWSSDGKFISFVKVYADKSSPGIIDVKTGRYYPLENYEKIELSGVNFRWSETGNAAVLPEFRSDVQSGLYLLDEKNFNKPVNIGKKIVEGKADFYEAAFSPDGGEIGFIYRKDFLDDNNVLAVADLTGGNFKKLNENEEKMFPFFSQDGRYLYFVSKAEGNSFLRRADIESGESIDIAVLPENFNFWNNSLWLGDNLLMLSGKIIQPAEDISQKKGIVIIFDLDKNELQYSRLFDGNEEFLGISDN